MTSVMSKETEEFVQQIPLSRSSTWFNHVVDGPGTDLRFGVVVDAIAWMNEYSHRTERESCGMIVEVDGRQMWRGMANAAERSEARHAFKLDDAMVRAVMLAVTHAGGHVVAIVHSHPFVGMGQRGWTGPSTRDLIQCQHAEALQAADPNVHIPEMVVWCPKAGAGGILLGYGAHGTTWRWEAPGQVIE